METPEHLEELLFPRLYAVSEIAWNEAGDYADFEHRAEKKIEIAAKQGVNCMTKDGWNPEGEARVQSAATFIAHMMNPGGIRHTADGCGKRTGASLHRAVCAVLVPAAGCSRNDEKRRSRRRST